jgi:hypothetical protein
MIMSEAMQAITDLDLEPIKAKLMHPSGEGWSLSKVTAVETEYRRFLYLLKVFPTESTAPGVSVDVFWHYHILDTMKYAADCAAAFGYFVHHYPYVGLDEDDAADQAAREHADKRMRSLYEQVFADTDQGAADLAAYCTKAEPAQDTLAAEASAYCTREATAYCTREEPAQRALQSEAAAYCTVAGPARRALQAEPAAYCTEAGAARRTLQAEPAAYCTEAGPARRTLRDEPAGYCTKAGPARRVQQAEHAAYCTRASTAYCTHSGAAHVRGLPQPIAHADEVFTLQEVEAPANA